MLFKTAEEIRKCISVNVNFEFSDIVPSIKEAERVYIIPAIGKDFYKELNTAYNAEGALDPKVKAAVEALQEAIAPYTYYCYLAIGSTQIGANGIQEHSTPQSTPARQWVTYDLKESLINSGDVALDAALEFLEDNKDDYPTWADSEETTEAKDLIISNAAELSRHGNIQNSRRTFLALKPYLLKAERLFIRPALCDAYFEELKDQIQDGNLTEDNEILLKRFIRPATAQFAVYKAIPELLMEVTAKGLRVVTTNNGIKQKQNGSDSQLSTLYRDLYMDANADLKAMKEFLINNIDKYPTYRDSPCYVDPAQPRQSINSQNLNGYIA